MLAAILSSFALSSALPSFIITGISFSPVPLRESITMPPFSPFDISISSFSSDFGSDLTKTTSSPDGSSFSGSACFSGFCTSAASGSAGSSGISGSSCCGSFSSAGSLCLSLSLIRSKKLSFSPPSFSPLSSASWIS